MKKLTVRVKIRCERTSIAEVLEGIQRFSGSLMRDKKCAGECVKTTEQKTTDEVTKKKFFSNFKNIFLFFKCLIGGQVE